MKHETLGFCTCNCFYVCAHSLRQGDNAYCAAYYAAYCHAYGDVHPNAYGDLNAHLNADPHLHAYPYAHADRGAAGDQRHAIAAARANWG